MVCSPLEAGKVHGRCGEKFLTVTPGMRFADGDVGDQKRVTTPEKAKEQRIRDGCEFGPVLIMNGVVNQEAYNSASGYNPRTAIGQRADGVVIFLCIDGRQAGSIGASYKDVIDIMSEYGAVNACNMDGGSSSVMLYNDVDGRYADRDYHDIDSSETVKMVNNYSVLQSKPRRMPNFWMVRPASEG